MTNNTRIAFMFPGQGSQTNAMLEPLLGSSRFDSFLLAAEDISGLQLRSDPGATNTRSVQLLMYCVECEYALRLLDHGIKPAVVLGHSLGEYPALVSAGVFSFIDGLELVEIRSRLMNAACLLNRGGMTAVMARDYDNSAPLTNDVAALLEDVADVWVANDNAPGQVIISGTLKGLEVASDMFGELSIKTRPLAVAGAFHSPCMAEVASAFHTVLDQTSFKTAQCPVVQNFQPLAVMRSCTIRSQLVRQMTSPVRWREAMAELANMGVTNLIEVGPGKVLQGLAGQADPPLESVGVQKFIEDLVA